MIKHVFEIYGKYSNVFGNIRKSLEMFGRCSAIFRKFGKFLESPSESHRNFSELQKSSDIFKLIRQTFKKCSILFGKAFGKFRNFFRNLRK